MRAIAISISVLYFAATAAGAQENSASKTKNKGRGKLTIGKETTYFTRPLDKDGYVDYAAALNERMGKGVTPANNANVLLCQALGPRPHGQRVPAEFYQALGIPPPPERGEYFIGLDPYVQELRKKNPNTASFAIYDQFDAAIQRAWTADKYPVIAAWLKANEKPLALAVKASARPHYYSPYVAPVGSELFRGHFGAVDKCREIVKALIARAMLRASQGDPDSAWQDLMVCHRLGRVIGRGPTLSDWLVGAMLEQETCKADVAFLDRTKPDAMQIQKYLNDLGSLPTRPPIGEKVGEERFVFLDTIQMVDRQGVGYLWRMMGDEKVAQPKSAEEAVLQGIDWDPPFEPATAGMTV